MDPVSPTPSLDFARNAALLHIPPEIYLKILNKAIGQTQKDLADLESALPVGNFDVIQSISHRLKGDYDNLRITLVSDVARELNQVVKEKQDKDQLMALIARLQSNFAVLKQKLSAV